MRQTILIAAAVIVAGSAIAQAPEDAVEARQGFMKMISIEMGTLSGMAGVSLSMMRLLPLRPLPT